MLRAGQLHHSAVLFNGPADIADPVAVDGFGTLTVSGGCSESINGSAWERYRSQIKSVVIETANASISTGAFQNCTNLKSVQLPDVLREIGDDAFKNCTGLTDIRFPYMLDSIGSRAFAGCTALKRVILPQDCKRLRSGAFQNCTDIRGVPLYL